MKLIGLTLAMMVATSCLVRPSEGFVITSAVAAAGIGAAATVGAAGIGAGATLGAASIYGTTRLLSETETGNRVLEAASNRASSFANRAWNYWGKRK